jgi:3-(3-hydroxy-phenyl)propionate hydroxylase
MFVQPTLEATLRRGLERFPGVDVRLPAEVIGLAQTADEVTVSVRDLKKSSTYELRARYLLAADGASSTVRRLLHGTFDDLRFDEEWLVLDALIEDAADFAERCIQYCRPSRPGTYIVGPGALRRWEIKLLPGERAADFSSTESVRAVLAEFTPPERLRIIRHAVYRFHAVVAHRWRDGRVFLIGDAAHQMPPFMGQGMCAGIRDTVNLAWKLDAVHRQGVSPKLLDSFEIERKRHVRTVVEHAKEFGTIIGELDRDAAAKRDERLLRELRDGRAETVRQNFIPGLVGGLLGADASGVAAVGAGELFPQPWVTTADSIVPVRLDHLLPSSGFAVVTFEDNDWSDQDLLAFSQYLSGPRIDVRPTCHDDGDSVSRKRVVETGDVLRTWAERLSASVVIVRPDRYVYGTASSAPEYSRLVAQLTTELDDPA